VPTGARRAVILAMTTLMSAGAGPRGGVSLVGRWVFEVFSWYVRSNRGGPINCSEGRFGRGFTLDTSFYLNSPFAVNCAPFITKVAHHQRINFLIPARRTQRPFQVRNHLPFHPYISPCPASGWWSVCRPSLPPTHRPLPSHFAIHQERHASHTVPLRTDVAYGDRAQAPCIGSVLLGRTSVGVTGQGKPATSRRRAMSVRVERGIPGIDRGPPNVK
jgi:hypothetical protein